MYELCVDRRLDKWEGAKILDVPEKTFVAWRTQFRCSPDHLRYDDAPSKPQSIGWILKRHFSQELET